ncbi:hypothetical protein E5A73_06090 [Sphingomonas gei]|uniref:Immunity protein Imm1 n=1 Tax=Sphingomonas gei TaxID=1395960 RepID=A0A4S1XIR9_9SPHN|nr:hypothetical protein [Sphingomonas gei]TGX55006.1 hypothetical protein E5A73_06090 [Sphingomonas gei]
MEFRFRIPTGETEELTDPAPILARIREDGSAFWNIGSGDAGIETGSPYAPLTLELYFDGEAHFQLRYTTPDGDSVTARDPRHGKASATIKVGGTPMKLAPGTLQPREAAAEIVRHFCATGEKHPDYAWE